MRTSLLAISGKRGEKPAQPPPQQPEGRDQRAFSRWHLPGGFQAKGTPGWVLRKPSSAPPSLQGNRMLLSGQKGGVWRPLRTLKTALRTLRAHCLAVAGRPLQAFH